MTALQKPLLFNQSFSRDSSVILKISHVYALQGLYEQAFNFLKLAQSLNPNSAVIYTRLGVICFKLAREFSNLEYSKLAVENFCQANEVTHLEREEANYINAKKIHKQFLEKINESNKKILLEYLQNKGFDIQGLASFFKLTKVCSSSPKEHVCSISLVN